MIRRALLIACAFALPSIAAAQRGGGSGATKKTDLFAGMETNKGPSLRPRDIEDMSPVRLFMDKRKDLKLTDAQMDQLKAAEGKLKDKNAPSLKAVDSLVHELGTSRTNNSDQETIRKGLVQASLREAVAEARGNYDAAAKEFLATLDADQQAKATEFLAKQKEEGDKVLREKMGGGGRREP